MTSGCNSPAPGVHNLAEEGAVAGLEDDDEGLDDPELPGVAVGVGAEEPGVFEELDEPDDDAEEEPDVPADLTGAAAPLDWSHPLSTS